MNDTIKQKLADKNKKLIDMVIERAIRDYPEDIALIGLTGSFSTNDFHEKSDLDLIIVNNTDKGWGIAESFILDDVGYDIYCTSWENLEQKAALENPGVSSLTNLQILYYSKPEYLEKLNGLKDQALQALKMPVGKECIIRAKKHIDLAKQNYADIMLSDDPGTVRYASGCLVYNLINSLVNLNNTCIKRGIKRYLEEILTYRYLPENFEKLYMSAIEANTVDDIRNTSRLLLSSVIRLRDEMYQKLVEQPIPTYDSLWGTYEECWCNYRNKINVSTVAKDKSYAFHAAVGAQTYLDEMTAERGTKKFDLMQHFDADNLDLFRDAFMQAMDEYLLEYDKVGRKVKRFVTFKDLYNSYMNE